MRILVTRRAALAGGVAALAAVRPAMADAWPTRPLRLIVPFAAGGPSDGVGRAIAEAVSPALGQPVVVDNRAGAGGIIGTTLVAQANDGHTLLLASTSHVVNPSLQPRLPYDALKDFEPIGLISRTPFVLVVSAASPLRSVADLLAAARERPGALSYASSGNGTLANLAPELFSERTGTRITNVTYRGEGALMPDLISGNVIMAFATLPGVLQLVAGGRLRALAVAAAQPVPALPGVPTLAAAGVAGVEAEGWQCLLAAKGTPAEGIARLSAALARALADPRVAERLTGLGAYPSYADADALRSFMRSEADRWGQVVRSRGITAD